MCGLNVVLYKNNHFQGGKSNMKSDNLSVDCFPDQLCFILYMFLLYFLLGGVSVHLPISGI